MNYPKPVNAPQPVIATAGGGMYQVEYQGQKHIQIFWWEQVLDEDKLKEFEKKLKEKGIEFILMHGVKGPDLITIEDERC